VARRASLRLRLTALYTAVLVISTAGVLTASYLLLDGPLHNTLPQALADDTLDRLARQYLVGLLGITVLGVALGWALAGQALAPLSRVVATTRRVTAERMGERVGLDGPRDEIREVGEALDAMLDRLEDAFDARARFVANASHELRSPLTVVRTEAEVALADPDTPPVALRDALEGVLEATGRTEALLDGLLLLARSQSGLIRADPLDLADCVRNACLGLRDAAARAQVTVDVDAAPAPVAGDGPLVERLVANLLDNAVRYNRPGGEVRVITGLVGDLAFVSVVNSGALVAEQDARRLAEPFERLGRRAGAGGSGLGLSIVASVAEAHSGTLQITPRPQGGLEVLVRLPARTAQQPGPAAPAARADGASARTRA
jgi:signal transduction histidine kinase